ncbi:YqaA family protein [Thiohalospira sp.]|uniref:YqaA family protein n=1 Tax=Thiohalospira sp. TaxID=3080549 RepID=UPI003980A34E
MRLFGPLYTRVMGWSRHPRAPWLLGGLSFAESSFFPVPPDVMLAPMAMARPQRAMTMALITTLASVFGGVLGWFIGAFALEAVQPLLVEHGYQSAFQRATAWFDDWGFWAILIAGFSPIPYKVFTIAAGALAMNLPGFVLASFLGRGLRFFLVAGLMARGGPRMEEALGRWVDWLGWGGVVILVAAWLILRG